MTALPRGVVITEVTATEPKLETLRGLLREYLRSDAVTRRADCYTGELAGLPGAYSPPGGCLLLAELGGLPAGCVALRPLDGARCRADAVRRQALPSSSTRQSAPGVGSVR